MEEGRREGGRGMEEGRREREGRRGMEEGRRKTEVSMPLLNVLECV